MTADLDQLREKLRGAVHEFATHQYAMQGDPPQRTGDIEVSTAPADSLLVIRLPSHTDPHVTADVLRFVAAQTEGTGIRVLVVPADEITTETGT